MRSRAARELRDRVLTGQLRPGDRLDLDEITREFGISRTPVREALLELSYEGLVAVTPRSGITVIGITPEDAVDNFAVLAALAGKAAEWATSPDHRAAVGRAAPAGHRGGRRPGRGRRQPAVPPRRQSGLGLTSADDVPAPGGAGGPGQLLRPPPGAGGTGAAPNMRPSSTPSTGATGPRPAPSPRPTSSTPVPRWVTGCGPTADVRRPCPRPVAGKRMPEALPPSARSPAQVLRPPFTPITCPVT